MLSPLKPTTSEESSDIAALHVRTALCSKELICDRCMVVLQCFQQFGIFQCPHVRMNCLSECILTLPSIDIINNAILVNCNYVSSTLTNLKWVMGFFIAFTTVFRIFDAIRL